MLDGVNSLDIPRQRMPETAKDQLRDYCGSLFEAEAYHALDMQQASKNYENGSMKFPSKSRRKLSALQRERNRTSIALSRNGYKPSGTNYPNALISWP